MTSPSTLVGAGTSLRRFPVGLGARREVARSAANPIDKHHEGGTSTQGTRQIRGRSPSAANPRSRQPQPGGFGLRSKKAGCTHPRPATSPSPAASLATIKQQAEFSLSKHMLLSVALFLFAKLKVESTNIEVVLIEVEAKHWI
jgi:hypothetical protein